jgi:cytochrome c553
MLLKSSTSRACLYCHVVEAPTKMYAGDSTLAVVGDTAFGWGAFYAHTTGCVSCHAVHGANTFKSADGTVNSLILKAQGVKSLGTIPLAVQPEVYGGGGSLYTSKANMLAGTVAAAGVTPKAAAITAQCSICHANYAVGEETINANYLNPELFQPASWATANGATTRVVVGTTAAPVSVLPGVPGITYTAASGGSAGSLIMAYKNHPMKAGGQAFKGAGASAFFTTNNVAVSATGSQVCQSCHNAPETLIEGGYYVQSFPHYTPGYYKFMAAQDQSAFSTPVTNAEFAAGRQAFFSNPLTNKPAIMNDGYCTKCHSAVGTDF